MFGLAVELGIDDPLTWYNAVGDKLVDAWLGYKLNEIDEESEKTKTTESPAKVLERLNNGNR